MLPMLILSTCTQRKIITQASDCDRGNSTLNVSTNFFRSRAPVDVLLRFLDTIMSAKVFSILPEGLAVQSPAVKKVSAALSHRYENHYEK